MPAKLPRKKYSVMGHSPRTTAFTLVEIMIVVAIIGLLAAIAIPNFVRTREQTQTNACINNLRQIDAAKQQWALESRSTSASIPDFTNIAPFMVRAGTGRVPLCPANSSPNFTDSYDILSVAQSPQCITGITTHVMPF